MATDRFIVVCVILGSFTILCTLLMLNMTADKYQVTEYTKMTWNKIGNSKAGCILQAKDVREKENTTTTEFLGTGYFPPFLNSLSLTEAQMLLYGNIISVDFTCETKKRFGNVGDGGYEVCLDEPLGPRKNDCLVYSFGIRNEWSFDNAINSILGCEVHSFDPSMGVEDHIHREPNMFFYNLGIWGSNIRNEKKWELRDLATIVKRLKHENRVIDYVKFDVEGSEWPLITHLIKSDVHKQIKQMALELHSPRYRNDKLTIIDYAEMVNGLKELERLGFKKYLYYARNNCCRRFTPMTEASVSGTGKCCFETFYLNTNFL